MPTTFVVYRLMERGVDYNQRDTEKGLFALLADAILNIPEKYRTEQTISKVQKRMGVVYSAIYYYVQEVPVK